MTSFQPSNTPSGKRKVSRVFSQAQKLNVSHWEAFLTHIAIGAGVPPPDLTREEIIQSALLFIADLGDREKPRGGFDTEYDPEFPERGNYQQVARMALVNVCGYKPKQIGGIFRQLVTLGTEAIASKLTEKLEEKLWKVGLKARTSAERQWLRRNAKDLGAVA